MDIKKMVLILVSFVFLMAMSFSVSAFDNNNLTAHIRNMYTSDGKEWFNATGGIYYVKGTSHTRVLGQNYAINLSIKNHGNYKNYTKIVVQLPSGLSYMAGSNGTNSSIAANFSYQSSTKKLGWNASYTSGLVASNSTQTYFWFNVTVDSGSSYEGYAPINVSSLTIAGSNNLTSNLSIDNTAPTIANITFGPGPAGIGAGDNNYLYVFMDEELNGSGTVVDYNNWTPAYAGVTYNISAVSEYSSGGKSVLNLTVENGLKLGGSNVYNAIPTVTYYRYSGATPIVDLAGNVLANQSSDDALDKVPPQIGAIRTYNQNTGALVVEFNEPIGACSGQEKWTLVEEDEPGYGNQTFGGSSCSISSNTTTVTVPSAKREFLAPFSAIDVSLLEGAVNDSSDNELVASGSVLLSSYTRDSIGPTLSSWTFNANTNVLQMVFSERMNVSSYNNDSFLISYEQDHNRTETGINVTAVKLSTTVPGKIGSSSNTTINFTVENAVARNISAWYRQQGASTLYLSVMNTSSINLMEDMATNKVAAITNASGTAAATWTLDTAAPSLIGLNISNRTINARSVTATLTFNDEMNIDAEYNYSFTYTRADGSTVDVKRHPSNDGNRSLMNITWTPANSSSADGEITALTFNYRDDYNNSASAANSAYYFTLDTTAPTIDKAFFVDTRDGARYNSTNSSGVMFNGSNTQIVLEFVDSYTGAAENVTITYPTENQNASDVFNLSCGGSCGRDRLNDSSANAYMLLHSKNKSWVNITLGNGANITVRGVYDPSTRPASGELGTGINLRKQIEIRDVAGNMAVPNTSAIDIADERIEINTYSPNTTTISFPYCLDLTETGRSLPTSGLTLEEYVTGRWVSKAWSSTAANWKPLRGYRATNTGSAPKYIYVHTKAPSSCALEDHEVSSVATGWALLASDGQNLRYDNELVDAWMTTLDSTGSNFADVAYITDVAGITLYDHNGGDYPDWGTLDVLPYNGYWAWIRNTADFGGSGTR